MGARPVPVDVDPETLNIDPAQVDGAARALRSGERLAAIMPVDLYGHPCDRKSLIEMARRQSCALVEDAGARWSPPGMMAGQSAQPATRTSPC